MARTEANIKVATVTAPVGAKLTKTGQTVSYATGDDGDLQAGRDVDFLTLASNNPFGNTNRFTKTDGTAGSVGTLQWIIDWSTYDGSEVFGFVNYWWSLGTFSWPGMLTFCNGYSLDGYSGCRGINAHEIISLTNFEVGIGYLPILTSSVGLATWTTNTLKISNTFAYFTSFNDGRLQYQAKTNTYYSMPVRTFTVTGTTLT